MVEEFIIVLVGSQEYNCCGQAEVEDRMRKMKCIQMDMMNKTSKKNKKTLKNNTNQKSSIMQKNETTHKNDNQTKRL